MNVYITGVVPAGNELSDCLSELGKTVPELSVTAGSAQDTGTLVVPNGTVKVMSSGKVDTCGGISSAMDGENKNDSSNWKAKYKNTSFFSKSISNTWK